MYIYIYIFPSTEVTFSMNFYTQILKIEEYIYNKV